MLVANRTSLLERPALLPIVHELLERLEAHLVADEFFSVTCNVRAGDPSAFAAEMRAKGLGGLQGPTISQACITPALLPHGPVAFHSDVGIPAPGAEMALRTSAMCPNRSPT